MARKKKLKRRRIGTGSEYSPESSSEGSDGPTYDAKTKFMKLLGAVDKQLKQKNEAPTYAAYFTYLQSSRGGSKSFAEGKYSTQIALNYIKFASSRVPGRLARTPGLLDDPERRSQGLLRYALGDGQHAGKHVRGARRQRSRL